MKFPSLYLWIGWILFDLPMSSLASKFLWKQCGTCHPVCNWSVDLDEWHSLVFATDWHSRRLHDIGWGLFRQSSKKLAKCVPSVFDVLKLFILWIACLLFDVSFCSVEFAFHFLLDLKILVFSSFLKLFSLRHSLLDSKITSSLSLCYDQATLNALQRIILSTILMDDPSLQPLSCLQSELHFAIDSPHRSSRRPWASLSVSALRSLGGLSETDEIHVWNDSWLILLMKISVALLSNMLETAICCLLCFLHVKFWTKTVCEFTQRPHLVFDILSLSFASTVSCFV